MYCKTPLVLLARRLWKEGEGTPRHAGQVSNFPVCPARTWHLSQINPVFWKESTPWARRHMLPPCMSAGRSVSRGSGLHSVRCVFFRFKINFPTFLLWVGGGLSEVAAVSIFFFHGTLALPRCSRMSWDRSARESRRGGGSSGTEHSRCPSLELMLRRRLFRMGVWRTDLKPLRQFSELLLESVVGFHGLLEHFLALLVHHGIGSLVTLDFLALHEVTHDNGGGTGLVS